MDFPIFHLDLLGNRALIAIIAVLHVIINHGLAVGMMPLVAAMEWYGHKKKDPRWDILAHATYSHPLTEEEKAIPQGKTTPAGKPLTEQEIAELQGHLQHGKDVFMNACSRCHTGHGVNSVNQHLRRMYGDGPWDKESVKSYMENMHGAQPFMPPFPGNAKELDYLTEYLFHLEENKTKIKGAQTSGVTVNTPAPKETPAREDAQ